MAEENDAQEDDVADEMLRMMQEELGGEEADSGGAEEGDGINDMLEQEMLRAMEGEDGGASTDPLASFASLGPAISGPSPHETEAIDRLTDVDVEVTVELGDALIAIKEIMTWTAGSVVELIPEETEPVNVMLNGSLFAKGHIVVVGDNFGVRIVELLDPPDESGR